MSTPSELFSPFIPATTNVPEDGERLKLFLNQKFSEHADVINDKKIGNYISGVPSFNGEKWWYNTTQIIRNGYQAILYIANLNSTTIIINSASTPAYPIPVVTPGFVVTHVWGSASKPCTAVGAGNGSYFSFMAQGDARISFTMTDTEIRITTDGTLTGYSCFIVVEYLQNGT